MAVAIPCEAEKQWQITCDGDDMNELARKVDASFSPKSSPRGSRSPMATPNLSRNDSTGTLKMTISAGKHPAVVHSGPFYLMKVRGAEFGFAAFQLLGFVVLWFRCWYLFSSKICLVLNQYL